MSAVTLEARELGRGFAQAVPAAQQTFRAVLEAMSRPGRIQTLPAEVLQGVEPPGLSPALTALMLTLLDAEVSLWLHPQLATRGAPAYLRFHTGVRLVEQAEDADLVVLPAAAARPATWLTINPGTDTRPESAGTLILDAQALSVVGPLRLRGPGIEHEHQLGVAGLTPVNEAPFWQARPRPETNFPLGVDLMLCAGTQIAAVPRSTHLGVCAAEIQSRAGESCGANLDAGEALDGHQQRADNDEWPRKSPRPEGLDPEGGRSGVAPLVRGPTPDGALRLASPPFRDQRGPGFPPRRLPEA